MSAILEELAVPVVQAPTAGGPSTPALAAAVNRGGGLGFLAAGYLTTERLAEDIETLTGLTDRPFGVKLKLVREHAVPVVSFTFGTLPQAAVDDLHAAGCEVWMTVTSPAEGRRRRRSALTLSSSRASRPAGRNGTRSHVRYTGCFSGLPAGRLVVWTARHGRRGMRAIANAVTTPARPRTG